MQNRISGGPRHRRCNSAAFYSVNCASPDASQPHKNKERRREIAAERAEQRVRLTVWKYVVGKSETVSFAGVKKNNAAGRGDALRNYSPKTQHNTKRSNLFFDAQSSYPVALTFLFFALLLTLCNSKCFQKKLILFKATVQFSDSRGKTFEVIYDNTVNLQHGLHVFTHWFNFFSPPTFS